MTTENSRADALTEAQRKALETAVNVLNINWEHETANELWEAFTAPSSQPAAAPIDGMERAFSSSAMSRRDELELPGATAYIDRFVDALGLLCRSKPPKAMCEQWLKGENEELQSWAVSNARIYWQMGIGTIEAAQHLADNPEEGEGHEGFTSDYAVPAPSPADERAAMLAWAVERWDAEVKNRPLINVHRRSLDDTWRQVIRHCGGDDVSLLGPRHGDLLAANPIKTTDRDPSFIDSDLDFEPSARHAVADMANIGYALLEQIDRMMPGYHWNESPVEIVSDLINERDETRAKSATKPAGERAATFEEFRDRCEHYHGFKDETDDTQCTCPGNNHPSSWCEESDCPRRARAASANETGAEGAKPTAWAAEIIDALQGSFDTEGITENDSGDALIRLSSAIAAVEEVAESRSPAMAAEAVEVPDEATFQQLFIKHGGPVDSEGWCVNESGLRDFLRDLAAAASQPPAQADARVGLADALRRAREELSIVEWENDPPSRVVKLFDEIDSLLAAHPGQPEPNFVSRWSDAIRSMGKPEPRAEVTHSDVDVDAIAKDCRGEFDESGGIYFTRKFWGMFVSDIRGAIAAARTGASSC